jgi:site-specific DNA-methyltransferase (adenine-specific)
MTPPFEIATADVLKWLADYRGDPFHALLCDPPYHLVAIVKRFAKAARTEATVGGVGAYQRHAAGFMGQTWDGGDIAFRPETWAAFLPVLHPGAFGMAFAGSRGWHRLAAAIEDAGYILHPSIFGWLYGSGFPKATRIDTQIDREAGAVRPVVGEVEYHGHNAGTGAGSFSKNAYEGQTGVKRTEPVTAPATDLAKTWEHHRYGLQALKPALEPLIVFQKPYEGRPVDDITRTGAGALNIDGGRISTGRETVHAPQSDPAKRGGIVGSDLGISRRTSDVFRDAQAESAKRTNRLGRWPANFALAHAAECVKVGEEHWACVPDCPVRRLDDQAGVRASGQGPVMRQQDGGYNKGWAQGQQDAIYGDSGHVSRFFFTAVEAAITDADVVRYEEKADQEERERGLIGVFPCLSEDKPGVHHAVDPLWSETHIVTMDGKEVEVNCRRNPHPTVKPVDLVRWLARLLLPPAAYAPRRILIPFAGVGSEMIAAKQAEWEEVVGVELHERYAEIARTRLAAFLGMF